MHWIRAFGLLTFWLPSLVSFAQMSQGGQPYAFSHFISPPTQISIPSPTLPSSPAPNQFGIKIPLQHSLTQARYATKLPNGDYLYQLKLSAPHATSINLIYSQFHLPKGAKLYLYTSDQQQLLGAFTHQNNPQTQAYATALTLGDEVILEYYEPRSQYRKGQIVIDELVYGFQAFSSSNRGFGDSGPCQVNVNCSIGNDWRDEKKAVALIIVNGNRWCTGTLLNNTAEDCSPYLLTGDHCLGNLDAINQPNAAAWVFYWNYESPNCTPSINGSLQESTVGATLKANDAASDFALFELLENPIDAAYDVYFAGWSKEDIAANGAVGIHHPKGDVKKICVEYDSLSSGAYGGGNNTHWQVKDWDIGVTESVSSGSPLFDMEQRIIGQLHGGLAACNGSTDNGQADFYGKFAYSWENQGAPQPERRLKDWLDPLNLGINHWEGSYTPCGFGISRFTVDSNQICPNESIQFQDRSLGKISSWEWHFAGGIPSNSNQQHPLVNYPQAGNYDVSLITTDSLGGRDSLTQTAYIQVLDPYTGQALPFHQSFSGAFPPTNWQRINPDNQKTWQVHRSTVSAICNTNNSAAWLNNWDYNARGQKDILQTPLLDLSGYDSVSLQFVYAYRAYFLGLDAFQIKLVDLCGNLDSLIFEQSGFGLATTSGSGEFTPSSCTEWQQISINLSPLIGKHIYLQFINKNDYGNNLFIDDIKVEGFTNCQKDVFEPNNNFSTAPQLPKVGIHQNAEICPASDQDYFQFRPSHSHARIQLRSTSSLQISLYDSSHNPIDSSSHQITQNNLSPNTNYWISVQGNEVGSYRLYTQSRAAPFGTNIRQELVQIERGKSLLIQPKPQQHIRLYDMMGRLIYQQQQATSEIRLEGLAEGIYIIQTEN